MSSKKKVEVKKNNQLKKKKSIQTVSNVQTEFKSISPLMPELEELVKKNPNRLIGCGG